MKCDVRKLCRPRGHGRRAARLRPTLERMEPRVQMDAGFRAVDVTLLPGAEVVGAGPTTVSFGLPLPPGTLTDARNVRVVGADGREIPAHVRSLGDWNSLPPSSLLRTPVEPGAAPGVRSVLIQFGASFATGDPVHVLVGVGATRTLDVAAEVPVRQTMHLVQQGTFQASDGVYEPDVYALLPPSWLVQTDLATLSTSAGESPDLATFDAAQVNFFPTVINQFSANPDPAYLVNYRTDYEPWLYDRSQTFFNGYIRTGRLDFLREAERATDFYQQHLYTQADVAAGVVSPNYLGQFSLKTSDSTYPDVKYSYNESLATYYWLTGDASVLDHMADVTWATRYWIDPASATPDLHKFTERNAANALLAPLFQYEVTGDAATRDYARSIVDALYQMQNHPPDGLPPNGAFNHYVEEAHGVMSFSPWMSSLLANALLRAYNDLGDARIPGMLVKLAQAVQDRALYVPTVQGAPRVVMPRYAATSSGPTDNGFWSSWTDNEHAVDVAMVTALGSYFTTDPAQKATLVDTTRQLLATYQYTVNYWTRTSGSAELGRPVYRVSPPRKYNWWNKNEGAIGWALGREIPAPSLQFAVTSLRVAEDGGAVQVVVTRTGRNDTRAALNYATADGTATAGLDYTPVRGTLVFETGETSKTVTIPVLDDWLVEGNEVFRVTLSDPDSATLGAASTADVTVTDLGNQLRAGVQVVGGVDAANRAVRNNDVTLQLSALGPGTLPDGLYTYSVDLNGDGRADRTVYGGPTARLVVRYTELGVNRVGVTVRGPSGPAVRGASVDISVVAAAVIDDTLLANGTAGDDAVSVQSGADGRVTISFAGLPPVSVDPAAFRGPILIQGLDGDDTFTVGAGLSGRVVLDGGPGSDTLRGPDSDTTWSLTGADTGLIGAATFTGFPNLVGGSKADTFAVGPDARLSGTLIGGDGVDRLSYASWSGPVRVDFTTGTATDVAGGFTGFEAAEGGAGPDVLTGDARPNALYGGPGNDTLVAGGGNDSLLGGLGDDRYVFAEVAPGQAAETVVVGEAAGEGFDTLDFSRVVANGLNVNLKYDTALVRQFTPSYVAGASYTGPTLQLIRTAAAGQAANFEGVVGGGGNDAIVGNDADNWIDGRGGNNYLRGGGGNDTVIASAGNDALYGDDGDDVLVGGGGRDTVTGGAGTNTFPANAPNRAPTVYQDRLRVVRNSVNMLSVLANDADPDGDPLTIVAFTQPAVGRLLLNADGTFTYTPRYGFVGTEAFTYTVADGRGGTAVAVVTVDVVPPGTPL